MNARRVVATVGSENIGSIRVLEKIGMLREAFYEKDVQLRDRWRDSDLYAVSSASSVFTSDLSCFSA